MSRPASLSYARTRLRAGGDGRLREAAHRAAAVERDHVGEGLGVDGCAEGVAALFRVRAPQVADETLGVEQRGERAEVGPLGRIERRQPPQDARLRRLRDEAE